MTADERRTLREAVDARRRELTEVEADGLLHGDETTYRHGCQCDACRVAATAARGARRVRADRGRRERLLAACADGSPVEARVQVRAVMRMLNQAARRGFEQGGTGAILDGSVAGAAKEDDNR